jgi:hypothetical protein
VRGKNEVGGAPASTGPQSPPPLPPPLLEGSATFGSEEKRKDRDEGILNE